MIALFWEWRKPNPKPTRALAYLKNKYVRLFWLNQSISIEIFGQITKEDAIKIAENLK
ncbi:DUF4367 domain-containing protein [Desulfoscipio gibsoniae]|uniref:DUF4367 domain-containing protein n=1 Tax=Desulfoscipio gibsoniae TaxID=102134 RepID=UPI0002DD5EA5